MKFNAVNIMGPPTSFVLFYLKKTPKCGYGAKFYDYSETNAKPLCI
jgi:hypothetical protein